MKITTLAPYLSAQQMGNFNWAPFYVKISFLERAMPTGRIYITLATEADYLNIMGKYGTTP